MTNQKKMRSNNMMLLFREKRRRNEEEIEKKNRQRKENINLVSMTINIVAGMTAASATWLMHLRRTNFFPFSCFLLLYSFGVSTYIWALCWVHYNSNTHCSLEVVVVVVIVDQSNLPFCSSWGGAGRGFCRIFLLLLRLILRSNISFK